MSIQQLIKLSSAFVLLFAACTPGAQRSSGDNNETSVGKSWKKEVERIIDMGDKDDTIIHHLRDAHADSSFIIMAVNAMKAGQITAYANIDNSFTTKFSTADLNDMLTPQKDTVVLTDPISGDEITKVVSRDFNFDNIHKYRILENWTFYPASGKTEIQITGIAPVREIYGEDGSFRGMQALFWLKYDDVRGILDKVAQYHPNHNLNTLIWDDYFLSDVKPAVVK